MRTDLFTKIVLSVIAVALSVIATENVNVVGTVYAQDTVRHSDEYFESSAPKIWGRVIGLNGPQLVFEDNTGTIRYFNPGTLQPDHDRSPVVMKTIPSSLEKTIVRK